MAENQSNEEKPAGTEQQGTAEGTAETTITQAQFDDLKSQMEALQTSNNGLKDNNAALVKERRDDEKRIRDSKTDKATADKDFVELQKLHDEKITEMSSDLEEKSKNDSIVETQKSIIDGYEVTMKNILDDDLSALSNDQKQALESMPAFVNGNTQEKAAAVKWYRKNFAGGNVTTPGGTNGSNQNASTNFLEAFKKGDQAGMNAAMKV